VLRKRLAAPRAEKSPARKNIWPASGAATPLYRPARPSHWMVFLAQSMTPPARARARDLRTAAAAAAAHGGAMQFNRAGACVIARRDERSIVQV
jgi:hypothetical protein